MSLNNRVRFINRILGRKVDTSAVSVTDGGQRLSIVRDVNRHILVAVGVVAVVAVATSYFFFLNAAERQLEAKADEYINTIPNALRSSLWTIDRISAQSITEAFANNDLLAFILVTGSRDEPFVTVGSESVELIVRETGVFFNEQPIGKVRIGLATAPLRQEARDILWLSLGIIAVILAALYLFIRYFLQTSLQHPLGIVLERIQQATEGHYTATMASLKHHEFSTIIERFDAMADSVQQRERSLSETNRRMTVEIADRKRAQETSQRFMDILEATPDLVAMADRNGRVLYLNNGGRHLLGLEADDSPDVMQLAEFLPKAMRKQLLEEAVPKAINDGVWSSETLLRPRRGEAIPTSQVILAHKSSSGDVDYYSTIARDIRVQKRAEKQLKEHRDQLEQKVNERTRDLQQEIRTRQLTEGKLRESRQKAESANQAKSEFLANMSHELRTPLNGILGYAQILRKQVGYSEDKRREGLEVISECGEHLLTLINDILDLAKVEAGRVELQPRDFELAAMLAALNGMFRSRFQEKGLDFSIEAPADLPPTVHGDDRTLRQVLINLLGNALKFTDEGKVTLKVVRFRNEFQFEVEDSGIGISDEHSDEIFQPFSQLDNNSVSGKGTGLGLTISHHLVNLMGGHLKMASVVGVGSRFWFDLTLPRTERTVEISTEQDLIVGIDGPARRLLIVDDKAVNRAVLVGLLDPLGFLCEEALDGQECLDKVLESRPELILMDLVMPGINGLEVTRRLRRLPEMSDVLIVALSASAYDVHREQCLEAGCDEFLAKPVQAELLLDSLQRLLNLKWRHKPACDDGDDVAYAPAIGSYNYPTVDYLPKANAAALREAAHAGHAKGVLRQAAELEAIGEPYLDFAGQLRLLTKQFKFKQITALLESLGTE